LQVLVGGAKADGKIKTLECLSKLAVREENELRLLKAGIPTQARFLLISGKKKA
jgi:hypothetical protein